MAIRYPPLPGDVLICDFGTGFRPPEMVKRRPALVLSPRLRHRDGLCTVVPLSTTAPMRPVPYQCLLTLPFAPPPPFDAVEVWAKADMLATVGYARLDLMRTGRDQTGKRKYLKMRISPVDLDRVRACVARALGLRVNLT
ncbi:MAG: type II toxin-antitoxin system PemK/MazF family toxin [Caulobacteraceae bacterium]